MTSADSTLVVLVLYRLVAMLIGLAAMYMGYRLFLSEYYGKAGDLKAAWRGLALELKHGAPGTFFAVLGAFVMVVSLFKGFSVTPSSIGGLKVMAADSILATMNSDTGVAMTASYRARLREDSTALGVARKAVVGESISPEQRAAFLRWYTRSQINYLIMGMPSTSRKPMAPH